MRSARRYTGLKLEGRNTPPAYRNLVANGDFSNGTTGWRNLGLATFTASNGEATCVANSNFDYADNVGAFQATVIGRKYYLAANIKATSNKVGITLDTLTYATHDGSGVYKNVSAVLIATKASHFVLFSNTTETATTFYIKNIVCLDLTAIFGAGNEPSLAWCDANLPFIASEPVYYKNLVTNGNFSNGTTGWGWSDASNAVVQGVLVNTALGTNTVSQLLQDLSVFPLNTKIYTRVRIRVTNSICLHIRLALQGSVSGSHYTTPAKEITSPIMNQWYDVGGIDTVDSAIVGTTRTRVIHSYASAEIATGNIAEIQSFQSINLTAIFGLGNEPSLAWCDANLPFVAVGGMSVSAISVKDKSAIALSMPANLSDRSRFGNHGAFTNASWVQDASGMWMMDFTAANKLCTIPANASINDMAPFTFDCWIKVVGNGGNGIGRILDKGALLIYVSFGQMALTFAKYFSTTNGTWSTPTNSISLNVLHHIEVVHDRTTSAPIIYIDGILQILTVNDAPVGTPVADAAFNTIIGNRFAADRFFNGFISAPKIYEYKRSRTLTNLVTNGDFSNGTTWWMPHNSTFSVLDLTMTATGNGAGANFGITTPEFETIGAKHYRKVAMMPVGTTPQKIMYTAGSAIVEKLAPLADTWHFISGVVTPGQKNVYIIAAYADAPTANGKELKIKHVLNLNLTAIFGAGREPTAAQMDALLLELYPANSWFNGSIEVPWNAID